MSKSKYVANGSFGCVLKPHIPCSKRSLDSQPTGDTVSKLFASRGTAGDEYNDHKEKVETLDPDGAFTVKLFGFCKVRRHETPHEEIAKCTNDMNGEDKWLFQLVYSDGGMEVTKCPFSGVPFGDLIAGFHSVFKGLIVLESNKVCHNDIKPANMVFNSKDKAVRLIDFGLVTPFDDVYYYWKSPNTYLYHPPEANIIGSRTQHQIYDDDWAKKQENQQNLRQLHFYVFDNLKYENPLAQKVANKILECTFDINKQVEEYSKVHQLFLSVLKDERFETFSRQCVKSFDLYSVGVSLLEVIAGYLSCGSIENECLLVAVLTFIKSITVVNPSERLTPKQALAHYEKHILPLVNKPTPLSKSHKLYDLFEIFREYQPSNPPKQPMKSATSFKKHKMTESTKTQRGHDLITKPKLSLLKSIKSPKK
jgi:serine/threonine protein kinase